MVGIGTILVDNPSLTTRLEDKEGLDPIRIVVDSKVRIPLDAKVLNQESKAHTILVTTEKADPEKIKIIEDKGVRILKTPSNQNQVDLKNMIHQLGVLGIDSVLLEGGAQLNYSMLESGLIDKVISFIAPKIVGGSNAKTPVGGNGIALMNQAIALKDVSVNRFKEDIMIEGYIEKGGDDIFLQD
jgi:diaminohydroxyphosphoribosylaminopyrimidine deaminase/5-amino-6-(5-phosphoribosylamino)uracil reductase